MRKDLEEMKLNEVGRIKMIQIKIMAAGQACKTLLQLFSHLTEGEHFIAPVSQQRES